MCQLRAASRVSSCCFALSRKGLFGGSRAYYCPGGGGWVAFKNQIWDAQGATVEGAARPPRVGAFAQREPGLICQGAGSRGVSMAPL